jgi:hypothetical protein
MNFNLLLDYFNNKGKQRVSMTKIQDAIEIMNKLIEGNDENINHNFKFKNENENLKDLDEKKEKETLEFFKMHEKIDCRILFDEFKKIFSQKPTSDIKNESNYITIGENDKFNSLPLVKRISKERNKNLEKIEGSEKIKIQEIFENKPNRIDCFDKYNSKNMKYDEMGISLNSKSSYDNNDEENFLKISNKDLIFTNYLSNSMNKIDSKKIYKKNFEKYKSIEIALKETNKAININKTKNINFCESSLLYPNLTKSTGFLNDNQKNFEKHKSRGLTDKIIKNNLIQKDKNKFFSNKKDINNNNFEFPDPQFNFNFKNIFFNMSDK